MRIAISAEENKGLESSVSHHFGRCPYFVIVDVDGTNIEKVEVIENPYFAGHEPGMVPGFINEQGVQVMLSGGMGRRAIAFFQQFGISPATGAYGTVQSTLDHYFRGELQEAAPCRESEDHAHGHHHH
jgi:predicted Fe-Mo cluster-binding NifX family protein